MPSPDPPHYPSKYSYFLITLKSRSIPIHFRQFLFFSNFEKFIDIDLDLALCKRKAISEKPSMNLFMLCCDVEYNLPYLVIVCTNDDAL